MRVAGPLLLCLALSLANAFFPSSYLKGAPSQDLCPIPPDPYASPSQVKVKLMTELEQFAKDISELVKNDVGATVVNVVYRDAVIWSKGFGVKNMSASGPANIVDGDSIFRIGSITKVFTAMMMLQLRDMGSIDSLYSDVTTVLPELKIKNPFKHKRSITFDQLSSHMSGLPRETPCPRMFFEGCSASFDEIYANLSRMELMYPPGTWPQYSNLGVAVLGRALEKVAGDTWDNMLEQMILKPLEMSSTGISVASDVMDRLAVGYAPDGTVAKLIDIGFEAPAGQLYSTANDLSKLMMSIMNNIDPLFPSNNSLLDSETLREWMQPVYTYKDGTGYGRPWELVPITNYTLRTKGGSINGYRAEFIMAPEIKTGVVIMSSCNGCPSFRKVVEVGIAMISTLSSHLFDMDLLPPVNLPPNPQEFVGSYIGSVVPGVKTVFSVAVGELYGQKVLLCHQGDFAVKLDWKPDMTKDTFQISGRGSWPLPCPFISSGFLGQYVEFLRDKSGEINGITIEGLFPGMIFVKSQ